MTEATVYVAYEVSESKFDEIHEFVGHAANCDAALQGFDIYVERGELTCIECESEGDYTLNNLHSKIQNIISE